MKENLDTTTILIVEDSPTQAFQLKLLLEEHGMKVFDANDGTKALSLLKDHEISMVISDIQMPGISGFELCKIIKTSKETAHIPVILLTSLSGKEDVLQGIASGADSFINKPYSDDYLIEHLNELLLQFEKMKPDDQVVEFDAIVNGEKFMLTANPRRLFNLLTSTYEGARYKNLDLIKSQEALEDLNLRLEEIVKQRTEQVLQSERKYRAIVENALVGVYSTYLNGNFVFVNEAYAKMLEFDSVEELMQEGSIIRFYENFDDRKRLLKILAAEGQVGQFEFRLKTKKGDVKSLVLSAKLDNDLISGMVMDITELKKAELKIREINAGLEKRVLERTKELDNTNKELHKEVEERKRAEADMQKAKEEAEEATRAKSLFLANMSHEIRTPMNALLGFTEILSRRIADPVQKNYLNAMKKSGNALLTLINDLLDLSKAEAGKLELSPETLDIRYIIADIREILQPGAERKGVEFVCSIDEDVPSDFLIDELRIRQVLMNLAGNAIKFTDKGHIKINVNASNVSKLRGDLIIEVQDTGKGIPEKFQDKIFNLFEQQSGEINKKYGGTGMGLSISRQIVELMNGRIDLESKVGKGSTFKVILPRLERKGNANGKKKEKHDEGSQVIQFEPASILIADDAEDNLLVLREFLNGFSFDVIEAENGQEAIEQMEKHHVDLILTDVRMPIMDGLELVKKVRENEKWEGIPVVALSASDSRYDTKNYRKNGFDAFMRKPARFDEIEQMLTRFLKFSMVKVEEAVQDVTIAQSTLNNCEKIVYEVEKNVLPLRKNLLKIRPRKKVAEMADVLMQIGTGLDSPEIIDYGTSLKTANENFQVTIEKDLIENFLPWYQTLVESCKDNNPK